MWPRVGCNHSVRASHWGVLPSQGTDGHSVHLLKTLFAPCGRAGEGSAPFYSILLPPWSSSSGDSSPGCWVAGAFRRSFSALRTSAWLSREPTYSKDASFSRSYPHTGPIITKINNNKIYIQSKSNIVFHPIS